MFKFFKKFVGGLHVCCSLQGTNDGGDGLYHQFLARPQNELGASERWQCMATSQQVSI